MTCDICHGTGSIQRAVRSLLGNVMTSSPCGTCRGYGTVIATPCVDLPGPGPRACPAHRAGRHPRRRRHGRAPADAGLGRGRPRRRPERRPLPRDQGQEPRRLQPQRRRPAVHPRGADDRRDPRHHATVPALDGDVDVELKPGLQSGEILTVKDRGVTRLRGSGPRRPQDRRAGRHADEALVEGARPDRSSSPPRRRRPRPSSRHFQQGLFARLRDRFLG